MTAFSELFMRRALDLASKGGRDVMPNPQVGCVIVHDGKVIGEGWHKKFGEAHAEVNAVNSVADKDLLKKSTMYVTLEPCSHHGKTPPCTDMIIRMGIPRVIVASADPNPLVAGNGIKKLKEAGIEVVTGVLDDENRELNTRFFTFHEKKRPYVILKWAQSADGFIDKIRTNPDEPPQWITNEYCRTLVHKWRAREQAIIAGAKTVLMDNPKLNVRNWTGENPVRFIIAGKTLFPPHCNILDGNIKTYIFTKNKSYPETKNTEIIVINSVSAEEILSKIKGMNIQSLFVEGGSLTLKLFINSGLWDEARVFTGAAKFADGIKAPEVSGKCSCNEYVTEDVKLEWFNNC